MEAQVVDFFVNFARTSKELETVEKKIIFLRRYGVSVKTKKTGKSRTSPN